MTAKKDYGFLGYAVISFHFLILIVSFI